MKLAKLSNQKVIGKNIPFVDMTVGEDLNQQAEVKKKRAMASFDFVIESANYGLSIKHKRRTSVKLMRLFM